MIAGVVTWFVAAVLGQGATGEAALKALPADAEIVIRVRSLSGARDDLLAMIKAMSPTLSEQAGPTIEQALNPYLEKAGPSVADTPIYVSVKLPKPDATEPTIVAAITGDYDAILKGLAGGQDPDVKHLDGGLDLFNTITSDTAYAARRDGVILFGPDEAAIRAAAKAEAKTIDARLTDGLRAALNGGDIGIYVDAATLQERFADQIAAAREQMMALMDQAGAQMQAGQAEQAKKIYAAMFDAIKQADALALNVDLDAAALDLSGLLTVKADSQAAAALKTAKPGPGALLGRMPLGGLVYAYMKSDPETTSNFLQWNFSNLLGSGEEAKAAAEAMQAKLKAAGETEAYSFSDFDGGMKVTSLSIAEHPAALVESMKGMLETTHKAPAIKDVKVEANVATHRGFTLSRSTTTFDVDKLLGDQAAANPAAGAMLKSMFGDGTITTYSGTDGKQFVSIVGQSLDDAKAQIDAILDGTRGIGESPGFRAARDRLPKETNGLMLMSAQGLVRVMAKSIGTLTGGDAPAPPADMPKEPAFFGGSLTATPAGYGFDFVVPSAVGPVFEKGLAPLFLGIQGKINQ